MAEKPQDNSEHDSGDPDDNSDTGNDGDREETNPQHNREDDDYRGESNHSQFIWGTFRRDSACYLVFRYSLDRLVVCAA